MITNQERNTSERDRRRGAALSAALLRQSDDVASFDALELLECECRVVAQRMKRSL